MRWVVDTTGRFEWRPYYSQDELDNECERIVSEFLIGRYGKGCFPLSTDELSLMIERETSDLDLYADLSGEGEDVEGLTTFFSSKKPAVKIAQELTLDDAKSLRLRETMAHEYGHVKFHAFLWDISLKDLQDGNLIKRICRQRHRYESFRSRLSSGYRPAGHRVFTPQMPVSSVGPRCKKTRIVDAPVSDWMEWQASYAGGAILMPFSLVRNIVNNSMTSGSERAVDSIERVAQAFNVSTGAARVRLLMLGFLPEQQQKDDAPPIRELLYVSF